MVAMAVTVIVAVVVRMQTASLSLIVGPAANLAARPDARNARAGICATIPAMADRDTGLTTLERSAFWIYGVTAMILREPLGVLFRHASSSGWSDGLVRLEALRTALVIVLLSRLFLAAGQHFEVVYSQPDSAERYPRRNYPADFLTGMMQLLIAVAASTTVALHTGEPSMFAALASAVLLSDAGWLSVAVLLRQSAVPRLAKRAGVGAAILAAGALAGALTNSEMAALGVAVLLASLDAAGLIRNYGR